MSNPARSPTPEPARRRTVAPTTAKPTVDRPSAGKANKKIGPAAIPAKVFLVDDHPVVRHGMAQMIAREEGLEVCGQADTAADALKQIGSMQPDLVVVDITLADGDGIELVKDIKVRHEAVKTLVSSMHDEALYAERALRAGASGYVCKSAALEQLIQAIRKVLSGQVYVSDDVSNRMLHRLIEGKTEPTRSPVESLSDRELAVFDMIGQGFSTRQIAEKLYLSVKTIETYREHIKTKLHLESGAELVRHAVRYRFEQER